MAAAARPEPQLRFAGDLLASADRVGQGRGVRRPPPQGLGPAGGRGWAGLVTRERGLGQRARQARGTTWAQIQSIVASGIKLLVCDGGGLPLTAVVTAANVNDTTMFQAVVDDIR